MQRRRFIQMSASVVVSAALTPSLTWARSASKVLEKLEVNPKGRPLSILAMNRMAFGPSADDFDHLSDFHFDHYLESQLHPEKMDDQFCDQKIIALKLKTQNKTLKQLWQDHRIAADQIKSEADKTKQDNPNLKKQENELRELPIRETEIATWTRAIYSKRQLQEVLVGFWHDHFNVNGWNHDISPVFVHYDRDVIRKHAFGNFRELLGAVAKSPAMLIYLDNGINQSGNPNENYARELFELHTLGADHYIGTLDRRKVFGFSKGHSQGYVDGDVYEAARCFTGWRNDANQKDATNTGEFAYYEPWHDRFQKIILGKLFQEYQPPLKDGEDVLDLLSTHPGTAHYVCKKLCRRFISDDPAPALVDRVAKVFLEKKNEKDQLRHVMRAILKSSDFQKRADVKLKRPFELTVGMLRAFHRDVRPVEFQPTEEFFKQFAQTGERLFQWKTPDGYPDRKESWSTASSMVQRWRLADLIVFKRFPGIQLPLDTAAPFSYAQKVLGYDDSSTENAIELFLKKSAESSPHLGDQSTRAAFALAMISPEFQWK